MTLTPETIARLSDLIGRLQADDIGIKELRTEQTYGASGTSWISVTAASCHGYLALCAWAGIKRPGVECRSTGSGHGLTPHRIWESLTKDGSVLVRHWCWPWLDCWTETIDLAEVAAS